jgi:hypothetical protein
MGRELEYPLELIPTAKLEYFQERKGFNLFSIFSNPMILMSLVTIGMMFMIPKMKESIQDPEIKKEMEAASQKKPELPEMPDVASKLADWFSPKK